MQPCGHAISTPNIQRLAEQGVRLSQGWADRPLPAEAMYDLTFDPQEASNLADRPEMAGILNEMRDRLDTWMRRTDGPLLRGHLPLPAGATVNARDEPSHHGEPSTVI